MSCAGSIDETLICYKKFIINDRHTKFEGVVHIDI